MTIATCLALNMSEVQDEKEVQRLKKNVSRLKFKIVQPLR